ncbi:MAG: hypothetical protein IID08_00560 [Candidatus Hydrogenedentes bacterium]|nr:hypothetical protein [Candidatus Hydrogenedentota bacterium]
MPERINLQDLFATTSTELMAQFAKTEAMFAQATDRGASREEVVRKFFSDFLPKRYGVGTGFVVNHNNQSSRQIDIIIYDAATTPVFYSEPNQQVFPVDTVYATIEVKSKLNSETLKTSIENCKSFMSLDRNLITSKPLNRRAGMSIGGKHPLNPKCSAIVAYTLCSNWKELDLPDLQKELRRHLEECSQTDRPHGICIIDSGFLFANKSSDTKSTISINIDHPETEWSYFPVKGSSLTYFCFILLSVLNQIILDDVDLFKYMRLPNIE